MGIFQRAMSYVDALQAGFEVGEKDRLFRFMKTAEREDGNIKATQLWINRTA